MTSSVEAEQDRTPAPGETQSPTEFALTTDTRMVAAARVEAKERAIIDLCNSPDFALDKLKAMYPS